VPDSLRRRSELVAPPVRNADRHGLSVEREAEELECARHVDVEFRWGKHPPEGANDAQDTVHALLVAVLPNAAAKVVHVHNERRSEAARAHRLSRHCGEHTEYPYLPDLVFNDSLFQVQHRLDYLLRAEVGMRVRCANKASAE